MTRLLKPKEKAAIDGKPRKDLIRELTTLCHRFIRFRDCPGGFGRCVTCGRPITRANSNASHFIPGTKANWATKWDETNIFASCVPCNFTLEGNRIPYARFLEIKFGKDHIDRLRLKNQLSPRCPPAEILKLRIQHFKQKIKEVE